MKSLKDLLTNTWMNNPNVLAQIGHSLFGYALMLTVAYFSATNIWWMLGFAAALVVYATIKEFWYDANYEIPAQTNLDNWTDFAFYCVGLVVGFGVSLIKNLM